MGHASTCSAIGPALLERLLGLAVAVGAMALAAPAIAGDLTITPSLEFREAYSDNVDLDPDGAEESALTSEVVPGVIIRSESARVTAALNASPILRHQTAGSDEGLSVAGNLAGLGTVEVAEDLFFVDAQASISQQVLSSKAAGSTANEETVQVYRLSPYLRSRFGGFADAEARYRLSQIFIGGQEDAGANAASDSTTHSLGLSLDSGREFARFRWSVKAFGSDESRTDDDDVTRWETGLGLEYAFDRSITAIVGAGYQFFDDGDPANEIEEPTWKVGFRWRPGPRTELEATYGERDDDQSANVNFRYDISTRTSITASYAEILEKPQERLVRNVSFIELDPESDQFIDPQTGLPFDPNQSPFDIDNETTRTQTFRIGLNGSRGRTDFGLNAAIQNEEIEPTGEQEDIIALGARFSRRLNPHLTANLFAGYERSEFDDGQVDDEYTGIAGINYEIYANLRAGLRYEFHLQESSVEASEFTENRVAANLRITF
jgi:uncharacterized protein (PEP-CTERM system associated)